MPHEDYELRVVVLERGGEFGILFSKEAPCGTVLERCYFWLRGDGLEPTEEMRRTEGLKRFELSGHSDEELLFREIRAFAVAADAAGNPRLKRELSADAAAQYGSAFNHFFENNPRRPSFRSPLRRFFGSRGAFTEKLLERPARKRVLCGRAREVRVRSAEELFPPVMTGSTASPPNEDAKNAVRQWVLARHGKLEILGRPVADWAIYRDLPLLREIGRERLPRNDGAGAHQPDCDGYCLDRWEEELLRERGTYSPPAPVERVLEDFQAVVSEDGGRRRTLVSPVPQFLVLGPPGSGKSTLCRWLQWRAAQDQLTVHGRSLLPAYVRLVDWNQEDLPSHLAEQAGPSPRPTSANWRSWLEQGEVLLLLDGLDEVDAPILTKVRDMLKAFQACSVVVTCRTVSRERHQEVCPELPVFILAGLTKSQRDAYIQHFPAEHDFDRQSLVEQLDRTPSMQPLSTNPLLLSIIWWAFEAELQLPATRGELYEAAVTRLLQRPLRNLEHNSELPLAQRRRIIQQVAFNLFLGMGGQRQITFDETYFVEALVAAVRTVRGDEHAQDVADQLRTDLLARGVLTGHAERRFGFLHPTIQEYLTANELGRRINETGWEDLVPVSDKPVTLRGLVDARACDPAWHEVISLLAGQLVDPAPLLVMLRAVDIENRHPLAPICRPGLALAASCVSDLHSSRSPQIETLTDSIVAEAWTVWTEHVRRGTFEAVPELERSLARLAGHQSVRQRVRSIVSDPLTRETAGLAFFRIGDATAWGEILDDLPECQNPGLATPLIARLFGFTAITIAGQQRLLRILTESSDSEVLGSALRGWLLAIDHLGEDARLSQPLLDRMMALWTHGDTGVRLYSVQVFERLCESARSADLAPWVPSIEALLNSGDWRLRLAGARLLFDLGERIATPQNIMRLLELLRDENTEVRWAAGQAIGRSGDVAATPKTLETLCDLIPLARYSAAEALCRLGWRAGTDEVVERLCSLLTHRSAAVREDAARTIGEVAFRFANADVADRLLALTEDSSVSVKRTALSAIGSLGKDTATPPVFERLKTLLSDDDIDSLAAVTTVALYGTAGRDILCNHVATLLGTSAQRDHLRALRQIEAVGEQVPAQEVLPGVMTLLQSGNKDIVIAATRAIAQCGHEAAVPEVGASLLLLVSDLNCEVRKCAVDAIGRLQLCAGNPAETRVLVDWLGDPDSNIRYSAARAIRGLSKG